MRASTGEVLAYSSRGRDLAPGDSLEGRYPTGSTYKLVTSLALLEHGTGPDVKVDCPASVTIDGRIVTNFGGRSQSAATLRQAFAQSCNTAFATLGSRLSDAAFAAAASELGLGVPSRIGSRAFVGSVVRPVSGADRAVVASDGGGTLASPLALATVAATIDSGAFHPSTLVRADGGPGRALPAATLAGLRSMMAAAVVDGTAAGQRLPTGTCAKTGTAELEGAAAPRTVFAWLVGYRRDVAFAVLVVGGAQGGPVAGPIAARFLTAIG